MVRPEMQKTKKKDKARRCWDLLRVRYRGEPRRHLGTRRHLGGGGEHAPAPSHEKDLTQLKLRAGARGRRSKSALQTQCSAALMRHKSPQKGIKGGSSCHQRSGCICPLKSAHGPRRSHPSSVPGPSQVPTLQRGTAASGCPGQAGRSPSPRPGAPRRGAHLPHAATAPAAAGEPPGRRRTHL